MRRTHVPPIVLALFLIDAALALGYLMNFSAGLPFRALNAFIDLDRENNLPTWYSSVQWFSAALLTGLFAYRNFSAGHRRTWALLALPALFLALSLDEVTEIHEWTGKMSDGLLPGGRSESPLPQTGLWVVLVGLPFIVLMSILLRYLRPYFDRARTAFRRIGLGMAVMLAGAIGIESLSNLVAEGSAAAALQIFSEELMEMVGATIVVWGSYEWLTQYGFAFVLEGAAPDRMRSAAATAPRAPRLGSRVALGSSPGALSSRRHKA
jgi:hypothetical protein